MNTMAPTREDMIAELRRIEARDGYVSQAKFKEQTGWDRYWFDKHWPVGGYQKACEEAGVKRGQIFGIETNLRISDEELAIRFAEVVLSLEGRIPSPKRFQAVARMAAETLKRGDTWEEAKRRVINVYFGLPADRRRSEAVDAALRRELSKLNGSIDDPVLPVPPRTPSLPKHAVQVPTDYVSLVRDFRNRGEEEKRQLVAQFFHNVTSAPEFEVSTNIMTFECIIDTMVLGWWWK